MGTRADFYVGRGKIAEWLGSIAWDGNQSSIPSKIRDAGAEDIYRAHVASFIESRDDGTKPEMGWPWPWDDSGTTDYSYAFDGELVYACCFGSPWWPAQGDEEPDHDEVADSGEPKAVFPDMTERKATTSGKRSGVLIIGA